MDLRETNNLPATDYAPAVLDEPARLLLKAADLMEMRGLAKDITCDPEGRLCVRGALMAASGAKLRHHPQIKGGIYYWDESTEAVQQADYRLHEAIGEPPHKWNNNPARTIGEVVAKLRAVALSHATSSSEVSK